MKESRFSVKDGANYPSLVAVDAIEITILMDNYVDLILEDMGPLKRPPQEKTMGLETLTAEHGLSLWLTTRRAGEEHHLLLDTGYSPGGVLHNMDLLEIDPRHLEAVVLSHGHMDHTGGLKGLLGRTRKPLPVVAHDDAFFKRAWEKADGNTGLFPPPLDPAELKRLGAEIRIASKPLTLAGGTIMVSGPVPRRNRFEKGMPGALIQRESGWEKDQIQDDMALIMDLGPKGLALVSGCAHSGIINTMDWAAEMTGRDDFALVMGGFHLSGELMAEAVEPTVAGLKRYSPNLVIPLHCTGWQSSHDIARAFEGRFALSSVGSRLILD